MSFLLFLLHGKKKFLYFLQLFYTTHLNLETHRISAMCLLLCILCKSIRYGHPQHLAILFKNV